MRRSTAALLVFAAVPALLVVPTLGPTAAPPHPVAPRLTTVALGQFDQHAWDVEQQRPGPVEDDLPAAARTRTPQSFTAPIGTADYSLLGVTWDAEQPSPVDPEDLTVTVRTRTAGSWQPWTLLPTESSDGPDEGEGVVPVDAGSAGAGQTVAGKPARVGTAPYFAGPSNGVQVRVDGTGRLPVGLRVDLVDPGSSPADSQLTASVPSSAQAATGMPPVISRAQWGADESLRGSATYEPQVKVIFLHHTATSNSYTRDQAAAAVRSIYAYDTKSLGWSDIAYNVLIDKFGQVFEGRAGGLDRDVRSAATGGFNAQSWSISALGTYTTKAPSAALVNSIAAMMAWKLGLEHRKPTATLTLRAANGAGTTAKYPDGTNVRFAVISGHRDAGLTACPGAQLYAKLPAIRAKVESLMGAHLYATSTSRLVVPKGDTGSIEIQAHTLQAQKWALQVTAQDSATPVREYTGSEDARGHIDVSWDLKDSNGDVVAPGIYTMTLQSWTDDSVAVPYAVNVNLFADPNLLERPSSGVFQLTGRGYGHGHGMSQFGAEGAAREGLTAKQIVGFYYPGTKLETAPAGKTIRVLLSSAVRTTAGGKDIRLRPATGLQVSEGSDTLVLPAKVGGNTVTAWRTLLSGDTVGLYAMAGGSYHAVSGWTGRSGPFRFTTAPGASTTSRVTLVRTSGAGTVYRGVLEARRSGGSLIAVSAVLLDDYVKSVVSAEMPGGWHDAAYQAQAIAARSYAMFKRVAAVAAGRSTHICDTTACQVYNGYSGETAPESKAGTATAGQYLTYDGEPIFAEYSSADGGWTSDGGKPYLVAKADPYDGVVTGAANWGHLWSTNVSAAAVHAAYPEVGKVLRVVVLERVGHGAWGGRATSLRIVGGKGNVIVSGTAFRSALGLKSEWFRQVPVPPAPPEVTVLTQPPAAPKAAREVAATSLDRAARVSWAAPTTGVAPSGYRLTVNPGGRVVDVAGSARKATIKSLVNGRTYTVSVAARNAFGSAKAVAASVTPKSVYGYQVSVAATRIWSGSLAPHTDRALPALGSAGVPSAGVTMVALRVTTRNPTAKGSWLQVRPVGRSTAVVQQTVPAGGRASNVLYVAPGTAGKVALTSSQGVNVAVDVVGYVTRKGAVGSRLVAVTPAFAGSGLATPSAPLALSLAGRYGVPAKAGGVLAQVTVAATTGKSTVRISPDGTAAKAVSVGTVLAGERRTFPVMVPVGSDGAATVLASGPGARIHLDVQGYLVADNGLVAGGRFRARPTARLFDSASTATTRPSAGSSLTVPVLGHAGIPAAGVSAVLLNVSAVKPTTTGVLRLRPSGTAPASTWAVTYGPTGTVRTTVICKVGPDGSIAIDLPKGGVRVQVDVVGYITG